MLWGSSLPPRDQPLAEESLRMGGVLMNGRVFLEKDLLNALDDDQELGQTLSGLG